jgi:hypothetical protein
VVEERCVERSVQDKRVDRCLSGWVDIYNRERARAPTPGNERYRMKKNA